MNHLVFLDAKAGELEKILSGVKTMLIKEFDSIKTNAYPVSPGDSLYFLRDQDDCALCVKATVVRVLFMTNQSKEDLSQILKEMQPRLQLTEAQYNCWSAIGQGLLVEFGYAQKIGVVHVAPHKITGQSGWMAFETLDRITE